MNITVSRFVHDYSLVLMWFALYIKFKETSSKKWEFEVSNAEHKDKRYALWEINKPQHCLAFKAMHIAKTMPSIYCLFKGEKQDLPHSL